MRYLHCVHDTCYPRDLRDQRVLAAVTHATPPTRPTFFFAALSSAALIRAKPEASSVMSLSVAALTLINLSRIRALSSVRSL